MDERAHSQVRVIHRVVQVLAATGVPIWLFGGWGLDARIGRITRHHGDVEFWVRRADRLRSAEVLVGAGAQALSTQPPEESREFIWDGVSFSTAYVEQQGDGTFTVRGRWSDWRFPSGSFDEEPGVLGGVPVPVMSVAGMLAMKEQFPALRNGRPWRDKDVLDIATLARLRSEPGGRRKE